jgi:hypothetical protein
MCNRPWTNTQTRAQYWFGDMAFKYGVVSSSISWIQFLFYAETDQSLLFVESWEKAKTMCECYDYLFEIAVKMKSIGIDPAVKPASEPEYE